MNPFFQASRRSLAYQFSIIAPLWCPPFSNFRKIFHFQPCFGQNFSSQDANFPNFRSQDPSFFKENPLPRPYFWKPVWHTPTKKKLSAPPGKPPHFETSIFSYRSFFISKPCTCPVLSNLLWLNYLRSRGISMENFHRSLFAVTWI